MDAFDDELVVDIPIKGPKGAKGRRRAAIDFNGSLRLEEVCRCIDRDGNYVRLGRLQGRPEKSLIAGKDAGNCLKQSETLLRELEVENDASLPLAKSHDGFFFVKKTRSAAARLFRLLPALDECLNRNLVNSEYMEEFKRSLSKLEEDGISIKDLARLASGAPTPEPFERFGHMLKGLLAKYGSQEFKRRAHNRWWSSVRKEEGMIQSVDSFLERSSSLYVVKLDCGYETQELRRAFSRSLQDHDVDVRDIGPVCRDRFRFLNNLRCKSWCRPLLGYVWKIEFSLLRGYYIHFIFFFDGEAVGPKDKLEQVLEDCWGRYATAGSPLAFDCRDSLNAFRSMGAGRIQCDDSAAVTKIYDAVRFLAVSDEYFRVNAGRGIDIIGRSDTVIRDKAWKEPVESNVRKIGKHASEVTPAELERLVIGERMAKGRQARLEAASAKRTKGAVARARKRARETIMRAPLYAGKNIFQSDGAAEGRGLCQVDATEQGGSASDSNGDALKRLVDKVNFNVHRSA